jgi:hypothetical protein
MVLPLLVIILASGGANYLALEGAVEDVGRGLHRDGEARRHGGDAKEMAQQLEKLEAEKKELVEAKEQAIKDARRSRSSSPS